MTDTNRVDDLAQRMYYGALCDTDTDYRDWSAVVESIEQQAALIMVNPDPIVEAAKQYHEEAAPFREAIELCERGQ